MTTSSRSRKLVRLGFTSVTFSAGSSSIARPLLEGKPRRDVFLSSLGHILGKQRLFLQRHFIYPTAWNSESLKDFIDRSELIVPFPIP
jgi:hypothetical protein